MRNITSSMVLATLLILAVSSCKKETSSAFIGPNNAAPTISVSGANYFVSTRVKTSENYNQTQYTCEGTKRIFSITNTSNGGQFTVGCANAVVGLPLFPQESLLSLSLYCNNYRLGFSGGCVIPTPTPVTSGYSDTIIFGPVSNWVSNTVGNGDTVIWSYADSGSVPVIADIVSGETVSTKAAYTLTAQGNVVGDSVIFSITGPSATVSHVLGPNTSSYTFTAAEMASLGSTGNNKGGLLQIAPYNFHPQTINGTQCYFAKQTCLSKYVILQ